VGMTGLALVPASICKAATSRVQVTGLAFTNSKVGYPFRRNG